MVAKRPIFSSGSIILVGFWVSRLPQQYLKWSYLFPHLILVVIYFLACYFERLCYMSRCFWQLDFWQEDFYINAHMKKFWTVPVAISKLLRVFSWFPSNQQLFIDYQINNYFGLHISDLLESGNC